MKKNKLRSCCKNACYRFKKVQTNEETSLLDSVMM